MVACGVVGAVLLSGWESAGRWICAGCGCMRVGASGSLSGIFGLCGQQDLNGHVGCLMNDLCAWLSCGSLQVSMTAARLQVH